MKIIAINGSPKADGNTAQAIKLLLREIQESGIGEVGAEIHTIGGKAVHGCIGCGKCRESQASRCAAFDDVVNELLPKIIESDALVLGSPVYYAGMNGTMKSFLDRVFFAAGGRLRLKFGAALVAVRRGGASTAVDQLNKYFQISEMTVVGSCYWNIIHGLFPGEIHQDIEGVRIIRTLGRNLAWLLKIAEHARGKIAPPEPLEPAMTNFVR